MSNREVIAIVRLMPGQGGYYDELSRIHLTVGNPQKEIYAGTNCTQLRRSVKSGRLKLLSGSFGEEKPPFKLIQEGNQYVLAPVMNFNDKPTVHEEKVADKPVTPVVETPAPAEKELEEVKEVAEEVEEAEEIAEEATENAEEAPKKRGRKKSAK